MKRWTVFVMIVVAAVSLVGCANEPVTLDMEKAAKEQGGAAAGKGGGGGGMIPTEGIDN